MQYPKPDASIDKVKARVLAKGKPDKTDVELLAGLLLVKAKKVETLLLAKPATGFLARKALQSALELERALASLADHNARPL